MIAWESVDFPIFQGLCLCFPQGMWNNLLKWTSKWEDYWSNLDDHSCITLITSYYMRITWWFPEIGVPANQSKSSIYGSFLHSKPTLIYGTPHILGFISFANSCMVESHEVGRHNSPAIFIFSGNETWLAGKSTIRNHLHLPIFFHGQDSVYHLVQGCSS